MLEETINAPQIRDRIVDAACDLLVSSGLSALSTRAIALAAGVPTPTIFRVFGDKDGLLEAVAWRGFETYLKQKVELATISDPVEKLRHAWDLHVAFGLSQPAFYTLVFGQARPGRLSEAGRKAVDGLEQMIAAVADAGRLRMSVERATAYMHANGMGTVLTLLTVPEELRDTGLSGVARDAVIDVVTTSDAREGKFAAIHADIPSRASSLREALAQQMTPALTHAEHALLDEWLRRLANHI